VWLQFEKPATLETVLGAVDSEKIGTNKKETILVAKVNLAHRYLPKTEDVQLERINLLLC
jgi:hypothetical protein